VERRNRVDKFWKRVTSLNLGPGVVCFKGARELLALVSLKKF
jgi:hypothetical protein